MKLICKVCYKEAKLMVEGNTYCQECYEKSIYHQEVVIKKRIQREKADKLKKG